MMNKCILFLICIVFVSCKSTEQNIQTDCLVGIVTDTENKPVTGYKITVENRSVETNNNGIFVIKGIGYGNIKISGKKECYETINVCLDFVDMKEMICLKIKSDEQIYNEVEQMMYEKKYSEAESLLTSVSNQVTDQTLIYKGFIQLSMGNITNASEILKQIKSIDKQKVDDLFSRL